VLRMGKGEMTIVGVYAQAKKPCCHDKAEA
jgi:hypothetical protein